VAAVAHATARALTAYVSRVDAQSANPRAAWVSMGSPDYPSPAQVAGLMNASQMLETPTPMKVLWQQQISRRSTVALKLSALRVDAYSLVAVRIPGLKQ
jgi:hypothetical protein